MSACLLSLSFSHVVSFLLSLRPLDVEFMRRLSKVVNIVPVIAKADTLTLEERDFFKKKVTSLWLYFLSLFFLTGFSMLSAQNFPFFTIKLTCIIQTHLYFDGLFMLAFFHVCGIVNGDRISSCGVLRWLILVLSSCSLDSQKHGYFPARPQEHLCISFPLFTLYFVHFLLPQLIKTAAVHLCVFIGSVFKDPRISPPLVSNEEAILPLVLCVHASVCLS